MSAMKVVRVGSCWLADAPRREVVERAVGLATSPQPVMVFGLGSHALSARRDPDFVVAMQQADLVHASSAPVAWWARQAGARRVERLPSGALCQDVLRELARSMGRPPRVALVGGSARQAARVLANLAAARAALAVAVEVGPVDDWTPSLDRIHEARPDLVVVGMDAPDAMIWCQQHRATLPAGLVLTCAEWSGSLARAAGSSPLVRRPAGLSH